MAECSARRVVVSSAVHSVESAGFLTWHALRVASDPAMAPTVAGFAITLQAVYPAAFQATGADAALSVGV